MKKTLIIGTQLAGKTTLVKYLRAHTDVVVTEIDEEILKRNNNSWPKDEDYKDNVLIPEIIKQILQQERIVVFASYLSKDFIHLLKQENFKIFILEISREEIAKRNKDRIQAINRDNASHWIVGEIELQEDLEKEGIVDGYIDAEQPTEIIADTISRF